MRKTSQHPVRLRVLSVAAALGLACALVPPVAFAAPSVSGNETVEQTTETSGGGAGLWRS